MTDQIADAPTAPASRGRQATSCKVRSRASWLALITLVVASLFVGVTDRGGARSDEERAHAVAKTIRCPTCRGQSVADSEAPIAVFLRGDIARRIDEGETDAEIRAALVASYGQDTLLNPPSNGIAALVWVIPVVGVVVSAAGVAFAFRRWAADR